METATQPATIGATNQPVILVPGEFYALSGRDSIEHGSRDVRIYPAMYVRDEHLRRMGGNWHIFAACTSNPTYLTRARALKGTLKITRERPTIELLAEKGLVANQVVYFREERTTLVNSFISDAFDLVRRAGPNKSTLEQDAYSLVGQGSESALTAKLKILIDAHQRKE